MDIPLKVNLPFVGLGFIEIVGRCNSSEDNIPKATIFEFNSSLVELQSVTASIPILYLLVPLGAS